MFISSIEIENIKGIKKLIFNPNKGFNLLVGENNIGKTSIFDAMLLWKIAYQKLIVTSGKGFYTKELSNSLNVSFNDLLLLRIVDAKDLFNNPKKEAFISINIELSENNICNLRITIEKPEIENSYIRFKNTGSTEDFKKFAKYCNDNNLKLKEAVFISFTKPLASIVKEEPFLNKGYVNKKMFLGLNQEILRNKVVSTMKHDKCEYLENKLKNVTGSHFKINLKNKTKDEEYIKLNISNESNEVDISLVGSGILHIIEIFTSLYQSEKNETGLNIVLIDEPDSHLHGKLQEKLINTLKEEKSQIFIITHNEKIIEQADDGELFYVTSDCLTGDKNLDAESLKNYGNIISQLSNVSISKPIIITEGKTDKKILEIAWNKLYEIELPYLIIPSGKEENEEKRAGSADTVKRTLESILNITDNIVIGLFDNDREGCEQFKGLDKKIFESFNQNKYFRKHLSKEKYALLLPEPDFREEFVTKEDLTQRYFVIEHYFSNEILESNNMKGSSILNSTVFKIEGDKNKFANKIEDFQPFEFENFKKLFEEIEKMLNKSAV